MSIEDRVDALERTLEDMITLSEENSSDRVLNEVIYALRVQGEVLKELAGGEAFRRAETRLKLHDLNESLQKFRSALAAPEIKDSPPLRELFEERVRSVENRIQRLALGGQNV